MSTTAMMTINPLLAEYQQQQHCCTMINQQQQQQDFPAPAALPETAATADISRLSFYLRCCVLGCGLTNNSLVSMELLDFTRAHTFSRQWQNMICQLSFDDFGLCNLLGRTIHVDTNNQILQPGGVPMIFLKPGTPEYVLTMNQLGVFNPNLPPFYTGYVMVCSSEWIETYHIHPFQRYMSSMFGGTAAESSSSNNMISLQQQQQQEETQQQESTMTSYPCCDQQEQKKVDSNERFEYSDVDQDQTMENIPMAAAVAIDGPSMDFGDDEDDDDVRSSLIVPGQHVKLHGLENQSMNGLVGVVKQRKNNRFIVKVANHKCKFSVRLENLIIVVDDTSVITATAVAM